jgi:hypothetical protein
MRALIYLNLRVFLNGIKRAFSSGRRIIGLLFFIGYYFFLFARPIGSKSAGKAGEAMIPAGLSTIKLPPLAAVETLVMAVFVAWGLISLIGMTAARTYFNRSDVDVLFATPVDRWLVIVFKFLRDSLFTAIIPLLIMLFFMRPATGAFTGSIASFTNPETSRLVMRGMMVAWLLSSLTWVALSYAFSLYFNRPEVRYDRFRRASSWVIGAIALGTPATIAWLLTRNPSWDLAIQIGTHPLLRAVFFIPAVCAQIAIAPISGNWLMFGGGCAVLIGLTGLGLFLASKQDIWAYEIAAMTNTAHQEVAQLQKQGDYFGMVAARAKNSGKTSRKTHFLMRWEPRGEWALIWRELIMVSRAGGMMVVFPLVLGGFFLVMMIIIASKERGRTPADVFFLLMLGQFCLMSGAMGQSGFLEMLRRGDLQKPLPFTPARVVAYEVMGKVAYPLVTLILLMVAAVVARPATWPLAVAGLVSGPAFIAGLNAVFGMLTIMFPDVNDPTQRGFRGLVTSLGMVLFLGTVVGVGVGAALLAGKSIVVGLLASAVPALLFGWLCSHIAGRLYSDFNPSD